MEIASVLEPYVERYGVVSRGEKIASVKRLIRVGQVFDPDRIKDDQLVYAYVRILDDLVDEYPEVLPVKHILSAEQRGLQGLDRPTRFQDEFLRGPVNRLFGKNAGVVNAYLSKTIDGMKMDLYTRYTQQPMTDIQLRDRNFAPVFYPLAIFSLAKFKTDPTPTVNVRQLLHDYGTYDNISDIFEDLPNGLQLISAEDQVQHNLSFTDRQPLPTEDLMRYNSIKRREVRGRLRSSSSAVFGLGLPRWFAALLYTYFYTRTFKLMVPLKEKPGLIYNAPVDALGK